MEGECTYGKMGAGTSASGSIMIWKAWEYTTGLMAADTKGSITTTRNADTEFFPGQMEHVTRAGFTIVSSMDLACI